MIAISTNKDEVTGKQMVIGWRFVTKAHAHKFPEVPGTRMYIEEKDVPILFYRDCTRYAYDNEQLQPVYPDRVEKDFKSI